MKKQYIIAVRFDSEPEIFTFPTACARRRFIEELEARWPGIEYATSELGG